MRCLHMFGLSCVLFFGWSSVMAQPPDSSQVVVIYHEGQAASAALTVIQNAGGIVMDVDPHFRQYFVKVPTPNIGAIAASPIIEVVFTPHAYTSFNNDSRVQSTVDRVQAWPWGGGGIDGLTGAGVPIGIWEETLPTQHADFGGRLIYAESTACGGDQKHATHVTGTLAGSGFAGSAAPPYANCGMAPGALLYAWCLKSGSLMCLASPFPTSEMYTARTTQNIVISQNSWGVVVHDCIEFGQYADWCEQIDRLVEADNLAIFFSAGNWRSPLDGNPCWSSTTEYRTIASPATAKNVITVGAVDENGATSSYSGFGPTEDGRLKPDIVAVGTNVVSTYLTNSYATLSGTSMACPAVSGGAALLVERYRQKNGGNDPSPALVKALLLNTAQDLENPGPDYKTGYGLMDIAKAVRAIDEGRYLTGTVTNGQPWTQTLAVNCACTLKVMMVYSDHPAEMYANPAIVNDLDLYLEPPVGSGLPLRRPLTLDGANPAQNAQEAVNTLDPVEQVVIAIPSAGVWTIHVDGTTLSALAPSQPFAITWEGADAPATDLYMRDRDVPLDLGLEPNNVPNPMWESRDIWVRNQPDGLVYQHQHQNPQYTPGGQAYVYFKARNRGCTPATGIVHLYWAKASTSLVWPDSWTGTTPLCNGTTVWGGEIPGPKTVTVPPGGEVVDYLEWQIPNPQDYAPCNANLAHFCLLARIETPAGMTTLEGISTDANVRNNNDIVWRNISIMSLASGGGPVFGDVIVRAPGPLESNARIGISVRRPFIDSLFFDRMHITLEMPAVLYERWRAGGGHGKAIERDDRQHRVRVLDAAASIDDLPLAAGEPYVFRVQAAPSAKGDTTAFDIVLTQFQADSGTAYTLIGGETFTVVYGDSVASVEPKGADYSAAAITAIEPNPASRGAAVEFTLAARSEIRLTLHDPAGRELRSLAAGQYDAGPHRIVIPIDGIPSGIYFVGLATPATTVTRRLVIVR